MHNIFCREESTLCRAKEFLDKLNDDSPEYLEEFSNITLEYERILRQLKLVTKYSDKTTIDLNVDKMNLLDKINFDVLTGIYNRSFLELNLKKCLKTLSNFGQPLTVMMLDLDYFKKYNDTYGHSKGDVCLRKVASALQSSISNHEDFVVRYGGEEFIMVFQNADKNQAVCIADKILNDIRELNILHENSEVADYVTISIGITTAVPKGDQNPQIYIERADSALYKSKSNGRNRFTYFELTEVHKND